MTAVAPAPKRKLINARAVRPWEPTSLPVALGLVCAELETYPTTDCVACTNSCAYCLSGTDTYCWDSNSLSRLQFALAARDYLSLPYTAQTHELLCYRMNVENTPDCVIASMATLVGSIGSQGSYAPTTNQCYGMLKIEWQYVNY
jgi:hypothetical protein